MFTRLQGLIVLSKHTDLLQVGLTASEKAQAATNAREVVDALIPAEYKLADIVDDLRGVGALSVVHDDEVYISRILEQVNAAPADGATAQRLFSRENVETALGILLKLAPLFL